MEKRSEIIISQQLLNKALTETARGGKEAILDDCKKGENLDHHIKMIKQGLGFYLYNNVSQEHQNLKSIQANLNVSIEVDLTEETVTINATYSLPLEKFESTVEL